MIAKGAEPIIGWKDIAAAFARLCGIAIAERTARGYGRRGLATWPVANKVATTADRILAFARAEWPEHMARIDRRTDEEERLDSIERTVRALSEHLAATK